MGLFCSEEQLISELAPQRSAKKIVFTNGCFDLLHVGHVRYLQQARKLGDLLVVGINSDDSVRRLKGPTRPVQNERDRGEILSALGCVDYVCLFAEDTPLKLIELVRPNILAKGGDWPIEKIVGAEFVIASGGEVHSLSFVEGKSTTYLVEKMSNS